MHTIIRLIERLTGATGIIAALLLIPLIIATAYEVFARYVLHTPTAWAFEVGYMVMGAHFLLGSAYTLREGQHVKVDLVSGALSERSRAAIMAFFYVLLLPCLAWLSYGLWEYAYYAWDINETTGQSSWNPRVWPYRAVFVISFILLGLQVFAEILKALIIIFHPKTKAA
ncbi:TRAP transporter small permease subunit [Paenalcaligenes niemegkensis]|uniref:TRAP transporter small permease subunit n=1 Tax=Paenalcaligenes niemegkensis TaxID=2895469 RepID=UPI001EE83F73|nr:TRAP transporter small permease subunit [Paenalcaligenes niemegkensis]MCQ9618187.1 TRAP transporter small permease subunit [Paenalcaligenes niemegkensis]